MSFAISRQIKLRSVEQAVFSPSYNRLNFFIQPDGLSTDLSQSYLSMRLYLVNALTGTQLTPTQMAEMISQNVAISFGNGDQSYTPACLIRTARLFSNKGNQLLEEVNFANVLTQTIMNQLCNDFETQESSNLLYGTSSIIGHGSSFPASISAFQNNPTEVHIMLRDLFGICRHSNFELASTDGLQITLELEDKQSLFRYTSLGDFQQIGVNDLSGNTAGAVKPEVFVNPAAPGYQQNSSSWASTPIAAGQYVAPSSDLFIDASGNTMIQHPKEGFYYSAEEWFQQPTIATAITQVTMTNAYTQDQLTALGFVPGAYIKLRYAITSQTVGAANLEPIQFVWMTSISAATPGANPALVFATNDSLWWDQIVGKTVNSLVQFVGLELLDATEVCEVDQVAAASAITTALQSNTLTVSTAQFTQLNQMGILNGVQTTGTTFDLAVEMYSAVATATLGSHIMPDVIVNELSPSIRQIFSNQLTKLPTQGTACRITNVVGPDVSGNYALTFTSWGCEANTSIQAATIQPLTNTTFDSDLAVSIKYFIYNVQNLVRGPNDVSGSYLYLPVNAANLSYQIDKFEIVLLQNSIDPKNRMPSPFVYSTWKLETATIETAQPTYARQFILEEGTYNCFLLTPQWNASGTDSGSLISTRRGVSHYRYSVNQVNQTNRDIYLSNFRSYYPSSLYLDRLNDTFANSDYILRSPVGIKTVAETADPVLIYPLKIYSAVSEQEYIMGGPGGATVQINMFSDTAMGGKIVPGNIFMFKQLLKQI